MFISIFHFGFMDSFGNMDSWGVCWVFSNFQGAPSIQGGPKFPGVTWYSWELHYKLVAPAIFPLCCVVWHRFPVTSGQNISWQVRICYRWSPSTPLHTMYNISCPVCANFWQNMLNIQMKYLKKSSKLVPGTKWKPLMNKKLYTPTPNLVPGTNFI